MAKTNSLVDDGFARACSGIEAEVRLEVHAEFAQRVAAASFWQRVWLKWKMAAEVRRRARSRIAAANLSPDALY